MARAIRRLDDIRSRNTRQIVYEHARGVLVAQLRSFDPPLSENQISRERLSLEEAIHGLEVNLRTKRPVSKSGIIEDMKYV